MEHAIIGAGNLGLDLAKISGAPVLSASTGFRLPQDLTKALETLREQRVRTVWVALGAGSVPEAKKDFESVLSLHFHFVRDLVQKLPSSRVIAFSTDYVANEDRPYDRYSYENKPRSLYAQSKLELENWARTEKPQNLAVVRVGSLYGPHKPERCFPAKLRRFNPAPITVTLPGNRVTPTPTPWLAELLFNNQEALFDGWPIHHAAPMGSVTVAEWGREILGSAYEVVEGRLDEERPPFSHLGCSFVGTVPTWSELWKNHADI